MIRAKTLLTTAVLALGVALTGQASADTVLRASHQWPKGDMRDEMVRIIARQVEKDNVGLKIQVYPGKSLFKPKEQWNAIVKGQLDITAFPLDYAGGRHPEFNLTLMPGLVRNHEHAQRLDHSKFMKRIKKIINDSGAMVLADTWLAGGFVSKGKCVLDPKDVKGMNFRAAGKAFNQMLAGAGASITSMPSSEIYSALQTGVLDGANTSSASLVSYRIYEQVKCLTAPGKNALWFMYEPILMSKKSFDKLNKKQQETILAAGKKAEKYAFEQGKEADKRLVEAYKKHGVKVVTMNKKEFDEWKKVADKTSYKNFADRVKGGRELLDMALSVK
ncbi:MAG TPA: TRAP transporter substrate-binding protein DctP [Gammaproteobacteria bacterium]|nr:TRAP transporter substrate-binding protein DctP [Gammaproteobacteria bacterium]